MIVNEFRILSLIEDCCYFFTAIVTSDNVKTGCNNLTVCQSMMHAETSPTPYNGITEETLSEETPQNVINSTEIENGTLHMNAVVGERTKDSTAETENGTMQNVTAVENASCGSYTTDGDQCIFPFQYKGVLVFTCTTRDHDKLWCATTSNYDNDKDGGNCEGEVIIIHMIFILTG